MRAERRTSAAVPQSASAINCTDPFDPTTWSHEETEYRIYSCCGASAIVDYEDYVYFSRWRWKSKKSKRSHKLYLKRTTRGSRNEDGSLGPSWDLYLHIEVMKRKGDRPPSDKHVIVHHIDGDSLNCRRGNLEWVTEKENNARRKPASRRRSA